VAKRGINLGCGNIILPCPRPEHHALIPDAMYTDSDIEWDNADWNELPGVNKVVDLFDYPWRETATQNCPDCGVKPGQFHKMDCDWQTVDQGLYVPTHNVEGETSSLHCGPQLPDNTYDYAIAAHICEHIPHHIVWEGQFVHHHPEYQDGWFAWFAELWRILKPGGTAHILVPYAWSNSAISDPTHTRYLTPATFAYFNNAHEESNFHYRMKQKWEYIDYATKGVQFRPHMQATARIRENMRLLQQIAKMQSHATFNPIASGFLEENLGEQERMVQETYWSSTWELAQSNINMIAEFVVSLTAVKDAD
jgi:hypothetical protein